MYTYKLFEPNIVAKEVRIVIFDKPLKEGDKFQILQNGVYTVYKYRNNSAQIISPVQGGSAVRYEGVKFVHFTFEERRLHTNGGLSLHV